MRIAFHGTNRVCARAITKEGFRAGTYFASNLADAIEFGGSHVFSVAFTDLNEDWQFKTQRRIYPSRIVALHTYTRRLLYENSKLRERIFSSNVHSEPWMQNYDVRMPRR